MRRFYRAFTSRELQGEWLELKPQFLEIQVTDLGTFCDVDFFLCKMSCFIVAKKLSKLLHHVFSLVSWGDVGQ